MTMTVDYFVFTTPTPPVLLRRTDDGVRLTDEAFPDNQWVPTELIGAYMVGSSDRMDDITEVQARRIAPAAF